MNLTIEEIGGEECRLFPLVGPLVMNPRVLEYNNNYPFKTSAAYTWYVAMNDGVVCGFVPVKQTRSQVLIDNYYAENETDVLSALLDHILSTYNADRDIVAVVHLDHKDLFARAGFGVRVEWKKYFKMDRQAKKPSKEQGDGAA